MFVVSKQFQSNPLRYYYDGRVHVVPEFDGVRLVTNDTCEFLHKVAGKSNLKK